MAGQANAYVLLRINEWKQRRKRGAFMAKEVQGKKSKFERVINFIFMLSVVMYAGYFLYFLFALLFLDKQVSQFNIDYLLFPVGILLIGYIIWLVRKPFKKQKD